MQAIVRREAEAIGAEISTDVLGTTIATVKGTTGGRTLALFAHADQVGDVGPGRGRATGCSRSRSSRPGTRAARARQRVRIATATGEVRGVVVAPQEGELSWDGAARRHRRRRS